MPTAKPRFTITMDENLFQQIENFKFNGRYKNQTKAVTALIEKGLEVLAAKDPEISKAMKKKPPYSSEALKLAKDFDCLDSHGKHLVRLVVDEEKKRCSLSFPYRLREAMGEMSVEEFVQKLGGQYKVQGILAYLRGERIPREKALHDMSECLGVSSDWLYGLDEDKNKKPTPPTTLYIAARDGSRTETVAEGKITFPEEDADIPE